VLLGRTDVRSYNQRITTKYGSSGRANYMEALSGADSYDLYAQMGQSVSHTADYVTMFMGHNDVCQGSFSSIPTDAQFEANVRAGLNRLKTGLPAGATIHVLGIVDIYKLWQLGDQLTSFGIIDCRVIWATSLLNIFPCATMLSPINSEADRQYTRSRNIAFNNKLISLVNEYNTTDANHYYHYNSNTATYTFVSNQVSPFDCFIRREGQKDLAAITWATVPSRPEARNRVARRRGPLPEGGPFLRRNPPDPGASQLAAYLRQPQMWPPRGRSQGQEGRRREHEEPGRSLPIAKERVAARGSRRRAGDAAGAPQLLQGLGVPLPRPGPPSGQGAPAPLRAPVPLRGHAGAGR
jgi:hypothetical protein